MTENLKKHVPLPKNTQAFICAICGAVSLNPESICKIQGQGTKADWCGTESVHPFPFCENKVHKLRFKCAKCGQVALNSELLCQPEQMPNA